MEKNPTSNRLQELIEAHDGNRATAYQQYIAEQAANLLDPRFAELAQLDEASDRDHPLAT